MANSELEESLQRVFNAGFDAGKEEDRRIEDEALTIRHLNLLIQGLHIEPEEAMQMLQIPKSKRRSYAAIFANRRKQKPEKYK